MKHEEMRVILKSDACVTEEVRRENDLVDWSDHVHTTAMRVVAAGVLVATGSLGKASSVLAWSGFTVPAGYFPEDHPAYDLFDYEEEKLRAWVEADEEKIRAVIGTEVFRLAATGSMLDGSPGEPERADEERLGEIQEMELAQRHEWEDVYGGEE